jgi:hypothetical protein
MLQEYYVHGTNSSFSSCTITTPKHTLGTNIIKNDLSEGIQYVIWKHLPYELCL